MKEVSQERFEIVKMFEARQKRTNKVSFIRYSLGDSGTIVGSPVLEGQLTFREWQLSEEYWVVDFLEALFESAVEISDNVPGCQLQNLRAGYSSIRDFFKHIKRYFD